MAPGDTSGSGMNIGGSRFGDQRNGNISEGAKGGGGDGAIAGQGAGIAGGHGGVRDMSGLNPNRVKGFGVQQPGGGNRGVRMETPTLNAMKAKQGAIVAKFMTFFRRKSTLVIEMYEQSFYKQKPTWDKIADFVYSDLCQTPEIRKEVKDVQFHPVKMLLFIRFSEDRFRDDILAKVQAPAGLMWSHYRVRVKGYSLDAEVKFVRLLGVSPETGEEEIQRSFVEAGIGEVIGIKKGLLDVNRLPGVTNGTWELRVKINDPERVIPSYIHRRDEGELWSLNFEGRVFCCWKCGSGTHIGDKCREQTRTFDEIFSESDDNSEGFVKPTWAAVVRSGNGDTEDHKKRVQAMEQKLKEENLRRDRARVESEEKRRLDHSEKEKKRNDDEQRRGNVVKEIAAKAADIAEAAKEDVAVPSSTAEDCSDLELLQAVVPAQVNLVQGKDQEIHPRSLDVAQQHREWLESRKRPVEQMFPIHITVDPELESIFGPGATRLALEYEGWDGGPEAAAAAGVAAVVEHEGDIVSTPLSQRSRGLKRGKVVGETESASSSHDPDIERIGDDASEIIDVEGSEGDTSDEGKDTKKPRLDVSKESDEDLELEVILSQSQGDTDNVPVTEVTREEDMVSSGDSDFLPPEKSSKGEEDMA